MDPDYQIVKGQTLRNLTLGRPSQGPDKLYYIIITERHQRGLLQNAQLFIQPWFRLTIMSQTAGHFLDALEAVYAVISTIPRPGSHLEQRCVERIKPGPIMIQSSISRTEPGHTFAWIPRMAQKAQNSPKGPERPKTAKRPRITQKAQNGPKGPECSKWPGIGPKAQEWPRIPRMAENGPKGRECPKGPKMPKITQNWPKRPRIAQNTQNGPKGRECPKGPEWSKWPRIGPKGQEWSRILRMAENGPKDPKKINLPKRPRMANILGLAQNAENFENPLFSGTPWRLLPPCCRQSGRGGFQRACSDPIPLRAQRLHLVSSQTG